MSKINHAFIGFIVIALIIFLGFKSDVFKNFKNPKESELSKQVNLTGFSFKGQLVSIEGDTMTLKGFFTSSTTPLELKGEKTLSFKVSSETSFRKLTIQMPSYESLRKSTGKTSGTYNIKDLPREEGVGSLADLKDSISKGNLLVQGSFVNTSFDTKNPTAVEVFYELLSNPPDEKI